MTNYLVVRLDECHTYDVVLHEAIQADVQCQSAVRPVPAWFDRDRHRFEAKSGRSAAGQDQPALRRAGPAGDNLSWKQLAVDDSVFNKADLVAGLRQRLGHALAAFTRYKSQYGGICGVWRRSRWPRSRPPTAGRSRGGGKDPTRCRRFLPLPAPAKRQKVSARSCTRLLADDPQPGRGCCTWCSVRTGWKPGTLTNIRRCGP